jgi:two-component system KDP operon response regulator KdpE
VKGVSVLIIDDNPVLCQTIETLFSIEGATVHIALDGKSGLRLFFELKPDLVILDVMMPEMSGWEVCRQMRMLASTPIIMLTAHASDEEVVKGLNSGADDFVAKPFTADVLLARSRAVLRRTENIGGGLDKLTYSDGYLTVDLEKRRVLVEGEPVRLTVTEFRLLALLIRHAERTLSYEEILRHVWGQEYQDSIEYVQVYLSHLRRKLEKDPRNPVYFLTEHGMGYRFSGHSF